MMTTTPNPTEAQIEKAARAFFREYHGEDVWPEIWDDGELIRGLVHLPQRAPLSPLLGSHRSRGLTRLHSRR